jgi:hypothetical protein
MYVKSCIARHFGLGAWKRDGLGSCFTFLPLTAESPLHSELTGENVEQQAANKLLIRHYNLGSEDTEVSMLHYKVQGRPRNLLLYFSAAHGRGLFSTN